MHVLYIIVSYVININKQAKYMNNKSLYSVFLLTNGI